MYENADSIPLKKMADDMHLVLSSSATNEKNLGARQLFFRVVNTLGLGVPGAVARAMSSEGFQRFLLANTGWQKAMQKALEAGDKAGVQQVIERVVRSYSAEGAGEVVDGATPEAVLKKTREAMNQNLLGVSNG